MKLRQLHSEGKVFAGIDVVNGKVVEDATEINVIEPVLVKKNVVKSAAEAATTILKIDDIIAASPLKKEEKEKGKTGGAGKFGGYGGY
jgi:chaperonin GroEL (HSP60 family)